MLSWPMIAFGWVTNMLQRGMASWKRMLEVLDAEPAIREPERSSRDKRRGPAAGGVRGAAPVIRGDIEFRDLTFALRRRRCSITCRRGSRRGRRWRSSASPARASRRSSTCWRGCTIRRRARCSSTASTCARCRSRCCAAPSASCRRSRSSSPTRWPTTSRSAWRRMGRRQAGRGAASTHRRRRGGRAPRQGRRRLPERLRHDGRGARHHALGRAEAAHRDRARVIIDPRILILDDALSAVDTYTEEEILSRLRGVMRQRTSIIVSHRISTVRDADQILVLDDGRDRRARDARRAGPARRALRGAAPEAVAGGGAGGVVIGR